MSEPNNEEAQLLRELAELDAEIQATESERAQSSHLAELRMQVAQRRQRAADAKAIAKAEDEHGLIGVKIAVVETPAGAVVLKRPSQFEWKKFQDKITSNNGSLTTDELWRFTKKCLVHPTVAELDSILEEYPGRLGEFGSAVNALATGRAKELAGK